MVESWSESGNDRDSRPFLVSWKSNAQSHPHGSIWMSFGNLWRACNVTKFTLSLTVANGCEDIELIVLMASVSSWRALATSPTSTKSPLSAQRAGRKPQSSRRRRPARGAVKYLSLRAKAMSCSGLKMWSFILSTVSFLNVGNTVCKNNKKIYFLQYRVCK